VVFAAVMLGLAGTWNVIDGILALANSKVYGVNSVYVFSDLRTWGWIVLLLGALQLFASFAVFTGSEFARWFGIVAAGLNAIAQLAFVPVYPFWALMMFSADILVIYGLAVYAGKKLRTA
jgi:predicted membrane metal-binding protein